MASPRGDGSTTGGKDDGRSDKSLRLSIKKRTNGLCKKAYELATLCDVELALVCYPSEAAEPITWPPDRSKIEDAIHHYFQTPAHKKLPKNQITLDNPNPGADEKKDTARKAAKAEEEADRLRIPFPDDEDKLRALGGILESRLEAVRKMIAVRLREGRRDPRPSARHPGKKLAIATASAVGGDLRPSAGDPGKKLAQDQGGPLPPATAVAAASVGDGDPWTSDRDRGMIVAGDCGPVWGWGHPGFSAAPNPWYPCPCCYCPIHSQPFTGLLPSANRSPDRTVVDGSPSCSRFTGSNGR